MMARDGLDDLVADFVGQLREMIKAQIRDTLEGRFGGEGKAGKPVTRTAVNGHDREKGEKRPPTELAAIQTKLLSFVKSHPGLRIEQINKELGTTTKDLQLPIRKLVAAKQLRATGKKRATTYAAAAGKVGRPKKRA